MPDGARALEGYLSELRARLRLLPGAEVSEILEELRGHVRDSVGRSGEPTENEVAAVLKRLGSPAELASLYQTESLLARAGRSRSPWLLLRSVGRWATVSAAGVFALFGLIVGYVVAGSFFCAAMVKPFAPARVGLFRLGEDEISLHLGLSAPPPAHGQELLGWWIVPLGLLLGAAAFRLTVGFARWAIRRFRRAPLVPTR
jgi:hypothetical protein